MDHNEHDPVDGPDAPAAMNRRAFFGRTLAAAGGAVALLGLTACPGGDGDDDDDDDEDDD